MADGRPHRDRRVPQHLHVKVATDRRLPHAAGILKRGVSGLVATLSRGRLLGAAHVDDRIAAYALMLHAGSRLKLEENEVFNVALSSRLALAAFGRPSAAADRHQCQAQYDGSASERCGSP